LDYEFTKELTKEPLPSIALYLGIGSQYLNVGTIEIVYSSSDIFGTTEGVSKVVEKSIDE